MFNVGDYAVCPGHGVAQIVGIEEKNFGSETKSLYILRIISNGMTVMVPVESENGIRCLVKNEEIEDIFKILGNHDNTELDKSTWNRRYREYMTKIKTGSLVEIASVLKALFLLKKSKKNLSFGEKKMFDQCKGLISLEISLSNGQDKQGVEQKIDSCFQQ